QTGTDDPSQRRTGHPDRAGEFDDAASGPRRLTAEKTPPHSGAGEAEFVRLERPYSVIPPLLLAPSLRDLHLRLYGRSEGRHDRAAGHVQPPPFQDRGP